MAWDRHECIITHDCESKSDFYENVSMCIYATFEQPPDTLHIETEFISRSIFKVLRTQLPNEIVKGALTLFELHVAFASQPFSILQLNYATVMGYALQLPSHSNHIPVNQQRYDGPFRF